MSAKIQSTIEQLMEMDELQETYAIPAHVIDQVTAALNAAIALSLMKEPSLHKLMMEAGTALDDAVNDQPEG